MEQIADILMGRSAQSRLRRPSQDSEWQQAEPKSNRVMSNDPEAADYNPPDPVPCEYCGKPQYTAGFWFNGTIRWNFCGPKRCDCPEAVAAYLREQAEREAKERAEREAAAAEELRRRVASIIGDSGMKRRFLQRTFAASVETDDNRAALRVCKEYADTFAEKLPTDTNMPGRNGLFITGNVGTGKTHLAAAIANQLMQEGRPVICMTMIDLLDRIKRTYEKQHKNGGEVTEDRILNAYKEVPLLIIDDMGKEPATVWAVSKIYAIINARYEAYMPTIITTNYTDSELEKRLTPPDGDPKTAKATIDRLREMCVGIVTTGDSWRSR